MNIKGSRILITGAGAGFGKAMALYFANSGAKVFALDIDQEALNNLKKESAAIYTLVCDVSDTKQIEDCVKNIFETAGGLEVLINNAGIMKNAPLINFLNREERKHSLELWDKIIAVNQSAVFYMTRVCADMMVSKRCKGVIVNISSISAKGNIGQTAYSASKAAVEAMSNVWAKELGRFGIRSVCIAPGFIDTAGAADAIEGKMLAQWIEKTPLRRTGKIDEIVSSVKFIIENDFVNGVVIPVNGGLTI